MSILSDIIVLPIIKALGLFSRKNFPKYLPTYRKAQKSLWKTKKGQSIYTVCLSKKILIEGEKDFYVSEFVPYTNKPVGVRMKYLDFRNKQTSTKQKTQVTLDTKVSLLFPHKSFGLPLVKYVYITYIISVNSQSFYF